MNRITRMLLERVSHTKGSVRVLDFKLRDFAKMVITIALILSKFNLLYDTMEILSNGFRLPIFNFQTVNTLKFTGIMRYDRKIVRHCG